MEAGNQDLPGGYPPHEDDPQDIEKRRLVSSLFNLSDFGDVSHCEDPVVLRHLLALTDALGNQPVTRRALLKLAALGGSLMFINGVLPQVGIDSCTTTLPFQGCSPKEPAEVKPDFSASVLRKQDMLLLRFDFYHIRLNGTSLERINADRDAYIVVNFAHGNDHLPQSIGEQAFLETAEEYGSDTEDPKNSPNPPGGSETLAQPGAVGARLGGSSRLVFKIPPGTPPIPFTLNELLSWEKFQLSVAPAALPTDETATGKMPSEPLWYQTAIEVPWQLIISPNHHAAWAHASSPVTHSQRTELWHTRLGVRQQLGKNGGFTVSEAEETYRT